MDWPEVGKKIAATGATLLGAAIGGPAGAGLGAIVSEVLGVENDPGTISQAIERDPEAAVKLQQIQSDERVQLRKIATSQTIAGIESATARQLQINETMRAEYQAEGNYKTGWRPFIGWVFGICIALLIAAMVYAILKDPTVVSDANFTGLLIWLFTSMAAILGVNIHQRTQDKRLAAGIAPSPGLLSGLIKRGAA